MEKKGFFGVDRLSHLNEVFHHNGDVKLWWASHKLLVKTWSEFCESFRLYYKTIFNLDEARTRLYSKQQQITESFHKFAYNTLIEFQQVEVSVTKTTVMDFVINHSHPSIRSDLQSAQHTFSSFEAMIELGTKLEKNRDADVDTKNKKEVSSSSTSDSEAAPSLKKKIT